MPKLIVTECPDPTALLNANIELKVRIAELEGALESLLLYRQKRLIGDYEVYEAARHTLSKAKPAFACAICGYGDGHEAECPNKL